MKPQFPCLDSDSTLVMEIFCGKNVYFFVEGITIIIQKKKEQ